MFWIKKQVCYQVLFLLFSNVLQSSIIIAYLMCFGKYPNTLTINWCISNSIGKFLVQFGGLLLSIFIFCFLHLLDIFIQYIYQSITLKMCYLLK